MISKILLFVKFDKKPVASSWLGEAGVQTGADSAEINQQSWSLSVGGSLSNSTFSGKLPQQDWADLNNTKSTWKEKYKKRTIQTLQVKT